MVPAKENKFTIDCSYAGCPKKCNADFVMQISTQLIIIVVKNEKWLIDYDTNLTL